MTSEHLVTAKGALTLKKQNAFLPKARVEKLPIVDENFNLQGTHYDQGYREDDQVSSCSKGRTGTPALRRRRWYYCQCFGRTEALVEGNVDVLLFLDSAHGHSENVLNCVKNDQGEIPGSSGNCRLTLQRVRLQKPSSRPALTPLRLVSDPVLSVPPVWLQVSVYLRSPLLWTARSCKRIRYPHHC